MSRPYTFHYASAPRVVAEKPGKRSRYPFATATNHHHLVFPTADFIIQQLDFPPFFIELFELKAEDTFPLRYEVLSRQHFLFFMLEGDISFQTQEGFFVSFARAGYYGFVFNNPGMFSIHLPPGKYTALSINISPDWLRFFSQDQPVMKDFLEKNIGNFGSLPYCRIDREVARWLKALYTDISKGVGSLDGKLRSYISLMLEQYDLMAGEKLQTLPYLLKGYLDKHFLAPDISLKSISSHFAMNERTLRHHFKNEFNITIHHYYTCRRLSSVLDLMNSQKLPLSKIYYLAGYNDENTLRYEMRKFNLL